MKIRKLNIDKKDWSEKLSKMLVGLSEKDISIILIKYAEPNGSLYFSEERFSGAVSFSPDELILLMQKLKKYSKENKKTGCLLWTGGMDYDGYGATGFGSKQIKAHRASYLVEKGSINKGLSVCHTCDNPSCINPDHLWLGTTKQNQEDCAIKYRRSGTRSGSATFTDKEVRNIRKMFKSGISVKDIAISMGRSKSTISKICHRKTWNHI